MLWEIVVTNGFSWIFEIIFRAIKGSFYTIISQVIIPIVVACFILCYIGNWYMDYGGITAKPDFKVAVENDASTGLKAVHLG